jgi:hypothetical protein
VLAEKKLSDDAFEAVPKIEERQVDGNPLVTVRQNRPRQLRRSHRLRDDDRPAIYREID